MIICRGRYRKDFTTTKGTQM